LSIGYIAIATTFIVYSRVIDFISPEDAYAATMQQCTDILVYSSVFFVSCPDRTLY